MFGRTRTDAVKDNVATGKELAAALARDRKFRKHLIAALGHGEIARRRVTEQITLKAALMRLAADEQLRREVVTATKSLQDAWSRVEKKRSHRLRNTLFVVAGAVAVAGVVQSRGRLQEQASKLRRSGASTDEKPEAVAPVVVEA
jgi:hypothetical protein